MRITKEEEILDLGIRKSLIEEILSGENKARKKEAYKRYQCFKDKTKWYVVENLLRQLDTSTVIEMQYALSNISIVRKIVDKLARVYSNGVQREVMDSEELTAKIQKTEQVLEVNTALKKTNRYLKLQKNVALYVKPVKCADEKWSIKLQPLNPYHYDVVEDAENREKAMCFIISDYTPEPTSYLLLDGQRGPALVAPPSPGNRIDDKIADSPSDQMMDAGNKRTFVFWTEKYHFTCDETGFIIPNEQNPGSINPFGVCPLVNFAIDQDGSFWAQGGDDLIDGAILINSMITHNNHVGIVQGYGQFFMTGENLPRAIKVGPTKAILAEYKKSEEQERPTAEFLSANPNLDSVRGLIEAYVALLLTSNNLSTTGISAQLGAGVSIASGIALMIDKAESLEDVQDQRGLFQTKEKEVFNVIQAIQNYYGSTDLIPELAENILPEDIAEIMNVKFLDPQIIMSETEKLTALKMRQELGLDRQIDMIMKDNPALTQEQAEEKLKQILEEKMKMQVEAQAIAAENGAPGMEGEEEEEENPEDQDEQKGGPNQGNEDDSDRE